MTITHIPNGYQKVRAVKPFTYAREAFQPGAVLVIDADSAARLIKEKRAEAVTPEPEREMREMQFWVGAMSSLIALNRARQASLDAEAGAVAASNWYTAAAYADKREQEALDATRRAALDRMEAFYQGRRRARAVPTPPPTSGKGWRVLANPKVSHQELEGLAHRVWDLAFHGIPFPTGWAVRWGVLAPTRSGQAVLGAAAMSAKVILIDEAAQQGRSPRELITTLLHELTHVCHPSETHGRSFEETLRRVLAYVLPVDELDTAQTAPRPRPEPRKGVTFSGTALTWPGADDWEFR